MSLGGVTLHLLAYWQPHVWAAGVVQTLLYVPFFVIYCRAKLCCLRPHTKLELVELQSLMSAEDGNGAGKFSCPNCGTELRDEYVNELKVGAPCWQHTVLCHACGEVFQVNLDPPSATEEASCAQHASAEFVSFTPMGAAARANLGLDV